MTVIRIEEIIDRLLSYHPKANVAVVQKAYIKSAMLHEGQRRKDNLPYLSHPLEVAGILTELKLQERAIAAGLLHDVVEDTDYTVDQMEKEFGPDIARLVDGVTKMGRLTSGSSRAQVYSENYRKMILAMARDVRVILIKLADRLHNMRTLKSLEEEKQKRIAQETLDIYAPIAGRLGIHWIQAQLEDLSFEYLKPELYFKLAAKMATTREARKDFIDKVQNSLKSRLDEARVGCEVTGRFKHLYSVYNKMEKQNLSFDEVFDLIAFRIFVDSIPACYDALRVIHSFWAPVPGRIKDYIALPKANMYRSLHTTVIGLEGERVEIQIRTREMHALAEYGIAAHWRYKEDGLVSPHEGGEEKTLEFVNHLVEITKSLENPYQFLESVKSEVIPDVIIAFTPGGDTIELPFGATPIDLAYAIHSDIGDRAGGAKINGKIVPLSEEIKSGDIVEIITSKSIEPQEAWLNFAKSSRARARINHFITSRKISRARELGRHMLEVDLLKNHHALAPLIKNGSLLEVARQYSFPSVEKMLEAIGNDHFPVRKAVHKLVPLESVKRQKDKSRKARKKSRTKKGEAQAVALAESQGKPPVVISSFKDSGVVMGACCMPLVGEEVGAVKKPDGAFEIHNVRCHALAEADNESVFSAQWDEKVEGESEVTIEVISKEERGMLFRLSSAIDSLNMHVLRAVVHTTDDKRAVHNFTIRAKTLKELNHIIVALEKIEDVIKVGRI